MRHFSSANSSLILLVFVFAMSSPARAQGLSAPSLQATSADGHSIALQWTDWEAYLANRIERKSGGSDWTLVAETGQANSYWDRTTVAGVTYTYRVRALAQDGSFTYSNEASATTDGPTLQPPAAPTFMADVSFNNILLRWIPQDGVAEYKIEMMDNALFWRELITLGGSSTNHLVTPLVEGMTYYFRITASNDAGSSPFSTLHITAPYDPGIVPPAPAIYATARTDTSLTIQWSYIPQAWGYLVESRSSPSDSWQPITNVSREITAVVHENLRPSSHYYYRIKAYNGAGDSPYSTETDGTTYPPPPSSPQLRGLPVSYKELELQWTDVLTNCCTSNGFIGYRLERWNGLGWTELAFAGVDDTNYFVSGLQPSTEYTYRIVALHPLASDWSTNTVRTMDPPPIPPPSAPSFFADPTSSTSIQLKWFDIYLETEYRIERENFPGAGAWQQIAILPAGATSYLDTNLQPATLYVYRIRAANSFGTSAYSDEAAAITRPPAGVPLLEAGGISSSEVFLFAQPAENATHYRLERLNGNGEWELIHETDSAPFGFTDRERSPSTPYTYRVGARSPAATWHYSATVTTQTWPLEFVVLGRALASSTIELSWSRLPYAEHIHIQKMTNGIWEWNNILELDAANTNHVFTDLSSDTSYTYRVWAANRFGRSPEAQVTVRTLTSTSGDIIIRSITPADFGAIFRLRLTGSTGLKFKVQSTADFNSWSDRTESLTLTPDMEVGVAAHGNALFYRTIKVD